MPRAQTPQAYSSLNSSEPALRTMDNSPTLWDILSTTTLSRCWPVLICTAIWSFAICMLNHHTHGKFSIQSTLITVFGTVLGFVISFRTTSSIERYNEGRKLWSQIMLNCRIFARTVWFHVPGESSQAPTGGHAMSDKEKEEDQAKTLIEKKTVVNLLEAYAVAVKHYLRGEDGINYEDLHPLVSFLPSYYSLPAIIPPANLPELHRRPTNASTHSRRSHDVPASPGPGTRAAGTHIPLSTIPEVPLRTANGSSTTDSTVCDEESILPSAMPPKNSWQAAFPFSFFLWIWTTIKKDARKAVGVDGAGRDFRSNENNVPLEISLFLSSYISALQVRKIVEAPTINLLYTSLNQLVDALTGLERILTTPIPVSYSSHLWMVTLVYCSALPFQLWSTLAWFSVPASVIASFIFFGFVVAGEEIENPFGYDRNDLNMDHFVQNIIRKELRALTATPTPDPADWAFSPRNNFLGTLSGGTAQNETPTDWLRKGKAEILKALQGAGSKEMV
ncbi:UPF0187-domain-containing protein [Rhizopogon vinicolor AM-OR11-026]|uniref:UPF0187-domain-containing protein n=1 Tax=Rhizopogon vinicolor AM-OR11-026 TaxID=1314800 RepID=A0A1B7ND96_9AGAM|nr:UPF0187-domain-containing protein [Rhizopogon vinicolor AM-OR11-026]